LLAEPYLDITSDFAEIVFATEAAAADPYDLESLTRWADIWSALTKAAARPLLRKTYLNAAVIRLWAG
jgi:hypothetical protein